MHGCQLEAATTPYLRSSSDKVSNLANAPLTLNEPVSCRDSSFKKMLDPDKLENVTDLCKGVFLTLWPKTSLALNMSLTLGNVCSSFASDMP